MSAESAEEWAVDGLNKVPAEVYVISVSTEWMIDVVSGTPSGHVVDAVKRAVERRLSSANVSEHHIKIYKARLTDVEEVKYVPAKTIPATLEYIHHAD